MWIDLQLAPFTEEVPFCFICVHNSRAEEELLFWTIPTHPGMVVFCPNQKKRVSSYTCRTLGRTAKVFIFPIRELNPGLSLERAIS
jgi:hypothetical protein